MERSIIPGVYPVMPTPLKVDETLNFEAVSECIAYYESAQVEGITVLGSGGELPYLTDDEQYQIVACAKKCTSSARLLVGVNAFGADHALQKIKRYTGLADAVMLLLDSYYDLDFEDYFNAVKQVADQSTLPILFYYFPQVTSTVFSTAQLLRLLALDNIIGIKDSSLHLPTAKTILDQSPESLYFTGLSLLLKPLRGKGAAGAICPIAALAPQLVRQYQQQLLFQTSSKLAGLYHQVKQLLPIINSLSVDASKQERILSVVCRSPMPLLKTASSPHANSKEALRLLGLNWGNTVRSPLPSLRVGDSEKIQNCLESASLL